MPRPLSAEEDLRHQQQLRQTDTLEANALRLIRATGIRVGESLDLALDCSQQVSEQQAAPHVPLGKLHSERWVPVDDEMRRVLARLVELRALVPFSCLSKSHGFLLPRSTSRSALYRRFLEALAAHALRADCTGKGTPHLRHSFATEMVRLGVSLPVLMQLLGHKNIHMTLRYVEVAQLDLQREFHRGRQNATWQRAIPQLLLAQGPVPQPVEVPALRQAIAATRHLFELLQPQLQGKPRRKLRRSSERLLKIGHELDHLKMSAHWPVKMRFRFVPVSIVRARRDLSRVSDERPTGALDSPRRASRGVLFYCLLDNADVGIHAMLR